MTPLSTPETSAGRRSPEEVRQVILRAARELFASRGYAGTSIREIAEHAGVYEPMIYRRVGSKAELFEAAVLQPLTEVVTGHLARVEQWRQAGPMTEVGRSWVEPMYDAIRDNRDLLLALMAAEGFHAEDFQDRRPFGDGIRRLIDQTEPEARMEVTRRGLPDVDVRANIVANLGMLLGVALLEGALGHDGEDHLGRERATAEMLKLVEFGIFRPEPTEGGPRRFRTLSEDEIARLLDHAADAERRAVRAELELELLTGRRPGAPDAPSEP